MMEPEELLIWAMLVIPMVVVGLAFLFAQFRLFSIDRTLKEILSELKTRRA